MTTNAWHSIVVTFINIANHANPPNYPLSSLLQRSAVHCELLEHVTGEDQRIWIIGDLCSWTGHQGWLSIARG